MSDSLVIIPTYNEKENIEAIVHAVFDQPKAFDILIIDDGSPDGTAEIIKSLQQQQATYKGDRALHLIQRKKKLGLGTAYLKGFQFAIDRGYAYVFEMDADFSHDPSELLNLYQTCHEEGYDVAVGSRYVKGVNVVNWPFIRVMISYFASKYVRFITAMPVHDTTAGFVCYKKKVLETIPLSKVRFIGYAFQIEMKFTAWKYGFSIKEIPIIFMDRTKGESKMSSGIIKEALFGVMYLKISSWFKKYHRPGSSFSQI